jgi:hypothetical protein
MRKDRLPRRYALRLDTLEDRALLTASPNPLKAQLAAMIGPSTGGATILTNNNDGPYSGVYTDVELKSESFSVKGSKTNYDVVFISGNYKFTQSYQMKINRIKNATPIEFYATDAVGVFGETLAIHIENFLDQRNGGGPAQPQQVNDDGFVIESARFKNSGGKTTYDLTLTAGEYRFKQSWTLKINRVGSNHNLVGLTAVEAVDLYAEGLATQIDNFLAQRDGMGNTAAKKKA